jgi:hypothetical protein
MEPTADPLNQVLKNGCEGHKNVLTPIMTMFIELYLISKQDVSNALILLCYSWSETPYRWLPSQESIKLKEIRTLAHLPRGMGTSKRSHQWGICQMTVVLVSQAKRKSRTRLEQEPSNLFVRSNGLPGSPEHSDRGMNSLAFERNLDFSGMASCFGSL